MSKLKHILIAAALVTVPLGGLVGRVQAQNTTLTPGEITGNLNSVVDGNSALGNTPLEQTLGQLINVLLGLLGIIFLILVIYAGFMWMTAAGDDKKVGTARTLLTQAVVGLVILLSAYAISNFVLDQLITATGVQT